MLQKGVEVSLPLNVRKMAGEPRHSPAHGRVIMLNPKCPAFQKNNISHVVSNVANSNFTGVVLSAEVDS